MRILLDSHALYWWTGFLHRIPRRTRELIDDPSNEVFYSPASVWELSIKAGKGKLNLPAEVFTGAKLRGIKELAITTKHALRTRGLPPIHFDPFDRMLIAQTLEEGLTLVTRDRIIMRYDVPIIEA